MKLWKTKVNRIRRKEKALKEYYLYLKNERYES
jgi:hypothetical protein